ncbi:MAG: hypothetical protein HQ510_10395 [Candidatus Marinimicrobia bacterium]|nr:hypothetical protein [Candidatus Neomarinimicrobiota bacterium]
MTKFKTLILIWLLFAGCSNSLEPVNSQSTISVGIAHDCYLELFMLNSYNTRVLTLYDDEIEIGAHDFTIPEDQLFEGVYNLVMIIDHHTRLDRTYIVMGN